MANKEKIIKKADKFVKQGKIDSAISEYNKIIEENPTDLSTINIVGDLYARIGKTTEAIKQFKQIAEFYNKDGFILKAIAIYKKINKLDPSDQEIYLKLAELYVKQNLPVEAASHYLIVAQHEVKRGNISQALDMYKKVIDLNPDNLKVRVKRAELLIKNNQPEQAFEEFMYVANGFRQKGFFEEADLVLARAKNLIPESGDVEILEGQLLLEKGDYTEAEAKFTELLGRNPENTKLLALLADTYQKQNLDDKAEDCWKKILDKDPDNEIAMLGFGRNALQRGDVASGYLSFEPLVHRHIEAEEYDQAISLVEEVLAVHERDFNALQKLLEIFTLLNNEGKIRQILKQIIEQAQADENHRLVYSSLKRLSELSPEDEIVRAELETQAQKIKDLGLAEEVDAVEEEVFQKEGLEEYVIEEDDISLEDVEKEMGEADRREEGVADLQDVPPATDVSTETEGIAEGEEIHVPAEARQEAEPVLEEKADGDPVSSFIEEVDFYLGQGLEDEARRILSDLSEKFPDHPQIAERMTRLEEVEKPSQAAAPKDEMDVAVADAMAGKVISGEPSGANGGAIGDEESFDYILREFRDDVHKQLGPDDFENHYNLGIAYKEMNLLNEAIDEFQIAAKDPSRVKECCSMIGICFLEKGMPDVAIKWFSKGIEQFQEPEKEESYLGMLYYLGVAYEYNGEFKKSLEMFNKLSEMAGDYRDVEEKIKNLKSYKNE